MTRTFIVAALLTLIGCDKPAEQAPGAEAPHAALTKPETAEPAQAAGPRLVTVTSPVTEIVFALGAGDQVVATDKSSLYPEQAAQRASLPYFRQLSAEGVLSQSPTLVLVGTDAGPAAALDQIEAAGVKLVRIKAAEDVEGARARIREVAAALGDAYSDEADALVAKLDADLKAAQERRDACSDREAPLRALFIYARGPGVLMVGGAGSATDVMFKLADVENAAAGIEGFKPLTAEAVVAAKPDALVFTTRGLEGLGGADNALKIPGVAQTPAGQSKRFVAIDDLKVMGMGPRMGEAARELIEALHECP